MKWFLYLLGLLLLLTPTLAAAPVVQEIAVTPLTPDASEHLTCRFNLTDADTDALDVTLRWKRDGSGTLRIDPRRTERWTLDSGSLGDNATNRRTLRAIWTAPDESWVCNVTVGDGTTNVTAESSSVTIQNLTGNIALTAPAGSKANEQVAFVADFTGLNGITLGRKYHNWSINDDLYDLQFMDVDGVGYESGYVIERYGDKVQAYNGSHENIWNVSGTFGTDFYRGLDVVDIYQTGRQDALFAHDGADRMSVINRTGGQDYDLTWGQIASAPIDLTGHGWRDDWAAISSFRTFVATTTDQASWTRDEIEPTDMGSAYDLIVADMLPSVGEEFVGIFSNYLVLFNSSGQVWNKSIGGVGGLAVIDRDHDGTYDTIIADGKDLAVLAVDNAGNEVWNYSRGGAGTYEMEGGDFDRDGYFDDFIARDSSGGIWARNNDSSIIWEDTAGTDTGSSLPYTIELADIDADGFDEVIYGNGDRTLYIIDHDGTMLYQETFDYDIAERPDNTESDRHLDIGDWDGDGAPDILLAAVDNGGPSDIQLYGWVDECQIDFDDGQSANMTWNFTAQQWEYNRSFSSTGTVEYNVTCAKGGYSLTSSSSTVSISDAPSVESVSILEATPRTNESLTCRFNLTSDNAFVVNVTWYADDAVVETNNSKPCTNSTWCYDTLDWSHTHNSQSVTCQVEGNSTEGVGAAMNATPVTIQNHSTSLAIGRSIAAAAPNENVRFTANYTRTAAWIFDDELTPLVWSYNTTHDALILDFFDCERAGRRSCVLGGITTEGHSDPEIYLFNETYDNIKNYTLLMVHEGAAGDFDNDSYSEDVAVVHDNGLAIVNLTDSQTTATAARSVATGDFDGDDDTDIVRGGSGYVQAFTGTAVQLWLNNTFTGAIVELATSDLDGDGIADVLAVERDNAAHLLNGTDGTGIAATGDIDALSGALIDLDADGTDEFIVGTGSAGGFEIIAYDVSGAQLWTTSQFTSVGARDLAVGDYDGDGNEDDFIAAGPDGETWAFNASTKNAEALWSGSYLSHAATAGDSDDDGVREALVGDQDADMLRVYDGLSLDISWSLDNDIGNSTSDGRGAPIAVGHGIDGTGLIGVASIDDTFRVFRASRCVISFDDSQAYNMTWNSTSNRWEANRTFGAGTYNYDITCSFGGYATATQSDSIEVGERPNVESISIPNTFLGNESAQCRFNITGGGTLTATVDWLVDGSPVYTNSSKPCTNGTWCYDTFREGNYTPGQSIQCRVNATNAFGSDGLNTSTARTALEHCRTLTASHTLVSGITAGSQTCLVLNANGITLNCSGHTVTGADTAATFGVDIDTQTGVTVENCIFQDFFEAVHIVSGGNHNITNVTTISSSNAGFYLNGAENVTVTDLNSSYDYDSVLIESSSAGTRFVDLWAEMNQTGHYVLAFSSGTHHNTSVTGLEARMPGANRVASIASTDWYNTTIDCQGGTLTNNDTAGSIGIYVVANTTVHNCIINDFAGGLTLGAGELNNVTNITIDSSVDSGVKIEGDHNTLADLISRNNGDYGLHLISADHNRVTGANLSANTRGIYIQTADNLTVTDVVLDSNTAEAVYALGGLTNSNISNATITLAAGSSRAAYLTSTANTGNVFEGFSIDAPASGQDGFNFNGDDHDNNTIDCEGKTWTGNDGAGSYGVYANGLDDLTVRDCAINDFSNGLYFTSASANNTIQENTIESSSAIGIYVSDASSNGTTFTENRVCGSGSEDVNDQDSNTWTKTTCDTATSVTCDLECYPTPEKSKFDLGPASIDRLGNLFLAGAAYENQGALTAPDRSFLITDASDTTVAYISSGGDLYLTGALTTLATMNPGKKVFLLVNSTDEPVAYFDDAGNLHLKRGVREGYADP